MRNNRNCPACTEAKNTKIGAKDGYEFGQCLRCRTLYTLWNPDEGLAQDYTEYSYSDEKTYPEFIDRRCDQLVTQFLKYRQANSFLDVGFGAGSIIKAAARAGWNVYGAEVSRAAVESLRKNHPEFELYHGPLKTCNFDNDFFDAVAIVEVIEHLSEPRDLLEEVYRILRPGGGAWVTTPSLNGLSWKLLGLHWSMVAPPDHIEIYSIKGVRALSERCGFFVEKTETLGINPFEILEYFKNGKKEVSISNRCNSGYELNEMLESGGMRKRLKDLINFGLNLTRLGDGVKVWLEKPL